MDITAERDGLLRLWNFALTMPRFRTTLQFSPNHKLRGPYGGPWDYYDFSHLLFEPARWRGVGLFLLVVCSFCMGSRNFPLENAAAERSGLSPHFALRAKWWPEVDPVSSCQHQSNDQQRYINSLRKVSSLSKAAKCLLFCLLRTFHPFKSCSTLATPNSSPLILEGGKFRSGSYGLGRWP